MTWTITLPDGAGLVVFEFLAREIDAREGAAMADALVQEGEFWALNLLHGAMERMMEAPALATYAKSVRAARAELTPAPEDTFFDIRCRGTESKAMGG
ncbi:MAG: hypothetical protein SGJ21_14625 [Alphaproteobacteria bacterium]|nr:hypothetical protein [Alphaproteobacteria bacterium]